MKKLNFKTFYSLVILTLIYSFTAFSVHGKESNNDLSIKMDHLLRDIYKADAPGAAVLVVKDGKTILRQGYGMGNVELTIPLNPNMVFRIGSLSKQFTAAAIMKLVEQGKVNLSDPLTKFLPDYPVHGHNISVVNLLTHTSGIKSYTNLPELMKEMGNEDLTVQDLIDRFKNSTMDFAPSTAYRYNNSGYAILGAIIEKVSGKSYENYIQDEIFTPLGMTHSYYGSFTKIIPNRAMGYEIKDGVLQNAEYLSMRIPYSAGALLSTVDDLAIWNAALHSGKVVSQESFKKMTTPYVLSNGKNAGSDKSEQGYGYALNISDLKGHRMVGHSGGINGFLTKMQRLEDENLVVIVLANSLSGDVDPGSVANQLSAIAIEDPFEQPKEITLDTASLNNFVGEYVMDEIGAPISVSYDHGKLYIQVADRAKKLIRPYSKTDFFSKNDLARYSFTLENRDKASQVKMFSAEGAPGAEYIAHRKP